MTTRDNQPPSADWTVTPRCGCDVGDCSVCEPVLVLHDGIVLGEN